MGTGETLDLGALEALLLRATAGLLTSGAEANARTGAELWRVWPRLREALQGAHSGPQHPMLARGEAFGLVRRAAHAIAQLRAENALLRAEVERLRAGASGDTGNGHDAKRRADESHSRT